MFQDCPKAMDELERIMTDVYKEGNSLVAMKDGQIAGALFGKITYKTNEEENKNYSDYINKICRTQNAKEFMLFLSQVCDRTCVCECNIGVVLEAIDLHTRFGSKCHWFNILKRIFFCNYIYCCGTFLNEKIYMFSRLSKSKILNY
jgi:hypothetical protein